MDGLLERPGAPGPPGPPGPRTGVRTWRLLTTWDGAPGFNMALDEALLELGGAEPVLRFYTWRPDTLSLGYFQRWADVPGARDAGAVVRRCTGGGAIHHRRELTFSIASDADHPLYRGPIEDSYARVHLTLAEGLAALGVRAGLREDAALTSDRAGTGMCFHGSTRLDLVWNGAKGVGSAQRRLRTARGPRVLHHGSIKLGTTELDTGVATLEGVDDPAALAEHLLGPLTRRLSAAFEPGEPTAAELEHARARAAHYTSPGFVRRR